jgi:phosphoserine aminotransferase
MDRETMNPTDIRIPLELLPGDGRFGSGPSKVRPEAVSALVERAQDYLGTSHRQTAVRDVVAQLRAGLRELFVLPAGHEVVLGNGGSTTFWDAAVFGLIENKSQHLVFGEFSSKFAEAAAAAPHLAAPEIIDSPFGTHPLPHASEDVDLYAFTQNETSTGVAMPVDRLASDAFTVVDATSSAGGMFFDPQKADVYYFAPQKNFASDGGLWIALMSPAGLDRVSKLKATGRHIPASLDLELAVENSRKEQTYNTPALATIFLMSLQVEWFLGNGGLDWAVRRCEESASILYGWADRSSYAHPFVADPEDRSPVVGTIDLDETVDAPMVSKVLRANGILDTEPYRKLGRNQLRIAMYAAIEPSDVAALTGCVDHVVGALRGES